MHGIYVLRSKKDGGLYVGYSAKIRERFVEHQKGNVASTKDRRPWEVIYCELYKNSRDAMQRERFLKTGWGRNYIKKILSNTLK
ncbi:MAG: GIY-YIG nuclease family protein [Candidatus Wolfebacteria bacterium]|nr:GIY-YIG nuclease family protein [Candidatus Wolfebacteria bacterium]